MRAFCNSAIGVLAALAFSTAAPAAEVTGAGSTRPNAGRLRLFTSAANRAARATSRNFYGGSG